MSPRSNAYMQSNVPRPFPAFLGCSPRCAIAASRSASSPAAAVKRSTYIGAGDPTHEVKDLRAKEALLQFGLTPADAVYVGDMTSDVRFAKRLGMRAVAVSYASYSGREALREAGPDALCDSVDELEHTLLSML